jgi:hypothetical protein
MYFHYTSFDNKVFTVRVLSEDDDEKSFITSFSEEKRAKSLVDRLNAYMNRFHKNK